MIFIDSINNKESVKGNGRIHIIFPDDENFGAAMYQYMYHNPLGEAMKKCGYYLFKDMYNSDTRYYTMIYRGKAQAILDGFKAAKTTIQIRDAYVKAYLILLNGEKELLFY